MSTAPQAATSREARFLDRLPVAASLAASLMVLFLFTGPNHVAAGSDEGEYFRLAQHMHAGLGFEGLRRTPVWPAILSFTFHLVGEAAWLGKVVNVILGAVTIAGVLRLARCFLPSRSAAIAALIVALLPTVFYLNATLYLETLGTCGFVWTNVLVVRVMQRSTVDGAGRFRLRPLDWAALGAAVGALNMVKPAYVVWPFLLALLGVVRFRQELARFASALLIAAGSFCLVMLPWWVRNWSVSGGHFVPFTIAGDQSLIESNNPHIAFMAPTLTQEDGRVIWVGPGKALSQWPDTDLVTEEELAPLDDYSSARLLRERALAWMRANPGTMLRLVIQKLAYGFGVWPLWQGSWLPLLMGLPFTIVMLLSIAGWSKLAGRGGLGWILFTHPLSFIAVTVIFFGSWRYRSAYEPSFVIAMMLAAPAILRRLPGPARRWADWLERDGAVTKAQVA